jgi:bifunctional DNA-binding transcriptional regulator/antitoxin component of YhaV-PrlF toxin-antitoxin module
MGETTVLTKAATRSRSLRTTIPIGIVRQFNLLEGDRLSWEIRAEGGELVIVVRPLKGDKSVNVNKRGATLFEEIAKNSR